MGLMTTSGGARVVGEIQVAGRKGAVTVAALSGVPLDAATACNTMVRVWLAGMVTVS